MQPTAAEVARTLARGRLTAAAHVACRPGPMPVRHATDCVGRPMLLCRPSEGSSPDDALAAALRSRPGAADVAVVLAVTDQPPVAGSPSLGRVWVSGWARRIERDAQVREAVLEFAEANPDADLLDVGRGVDLYRIEVEEVRLEREGILRSVDPEHYVAADPDPLHEWERDLLTDLTDHHGEQLHPYLAGRLAAAGVPPRPDRAARVVRLDRYGLVVAPYGQAKNGYAATAHAEQGHAEQGHAEQGHTEQGHAASPEDGRFVRLPFSRPVADRLDLAHLLHPVLFPHGCSVPGH